MSEVARFRQQQALEEEAAWNGLYGQAEMASHAAINARMDQWSDELLPLFEEGREEEALELWNRNIEQWKGEQS